MDARVLEPRGQRGQVSGYPVQPSKVQRPPLRDETLARDRLLDWLHVKVHHRVVYVIAEAGYGKTTLLADFSRRTRLRTLWYRLDEEDDNWVAFLSHLVAAGCEQDPEFAPSTRGLLREVATAAPALETVLDTFIREIQALNEGGAVFVLDDYHLVDDAPDVRLILKELLARAPERVTFVIASRRLPSLPVARLRGQGEIAELTTDDLRFNEAETEQLFRETYGRPLEPDVLNDLSRRTEGWAASLQLVQAAIRGRSAGEIRSFVRSISGAEGDLYDYLAEEVIGALPDDLQAFLMRATLLESASLDLLQAVTGLDQETIQRLQQRAERAGLLSRRSAIAVGVGFHPLVREFLRNRLSREVGEAGVARLHLEAAAASPDWATACHHLAEAGRPDEVHARLSSSIGDVLGGGSLHLAVSLLNRFPPFNLTSELAMIGSRAQLQAGDPAIALELGAEAVELAPSSVLASLNLASLLFMTGRLDDGLRVTRTLRREELDPVLREIANSTEALVGLSVGGNLTAFTDQALGMAARQAAAGMFHYQGISLLNAAICLRAQGEAARCLPLASQAVDLLRASGATFEATAASLAKAWSLAHLGLWPDATAELAGLQVPGAVGMREEALGEEASIHLWYGDDQRADELVSSALALGGDEAQTDITRLVAAELAIRQADERRVEKLLGLVSTNYQNREPGYVAHLMAVAAYADAAAGRETAAEALQGAIAQARKQSATFWETYSVLLFSLLPAQGKCSLPTKVKTDPAFLSVVAEYVATRLDQLPDEDRTVIAAEAERRPLRWRPALRQAIGQVKSPSRWLAAELLDVVGDESDVPLLRNLAKAAKPGSTGRGVGRGLARRLAPGVVLEDQGRVRLRIGKTVVDGSTVRRKVLALLCFLSSRRGFSATRDEVLEALWPELEPDVAVNSLNQTVYFLRRVFEPSYEESTSPGYLRFDSNVLWLDEQLVSSRSARCAAMIREFQGNATPANVDALVNAYVGRFALDFAYDEWSIPYRETLHAAYLQIVEAAVIADTNSGHYARGIKLARAALEVEPNAEALETCLVRLYRLSGAHAAAAEQYEHYASVLRNELGVEAPSLESV